MRSLLIKEFKLATPAFVYLFLAFTLMTFIPGYPILCGGFFVCLGMFQACQYAREANDLPFSLLLPVKKTAVVRGKYLFACLFEVIALLLCALATAIRMTLLADAAVYRQNALMPANGTFLAFVLLIFAVFNTVFIGGFFKTAYRYGKPFLLFGACAMGIILLAETLHHLPGAEPLFALDSAGRPLRLAVLAVAVLLYAGATALSCRRSEKRFLSIDL